MTRGSRVKSHVLLQVIVTCFDWYWKRVANLFRPFHNSIVSSFGIRQTTVAAELIILTISDWAAFGASNGEVRVSDVRLVHVQEGLQKAKNKPASTKNEAEKCSSSRLAKAAVRFKALFETRVCLYSGMRRE